MQQDVFALIMRKGKLAVDHIAPIWKLAFLPVAGCPCWKSGAAFVMKRCQSSAGFRAASSSTPEDLLAGTRAWREPWKWPGRRCRLLRRPPQMGAAAEGSARTSQQQVVTRCGPSVIRAGTRCFAPPQSGWREIAANCDSVPSCHDDRLFSYQLFSK